MSVPPTLVLEDDEKTIVDERSQEERRPRPLRARLTRLPGDFRHMLAILVAGSLFLSLAVFALHQRSLSHRLQRDLDALQGARSVVTSETTPFDRLPESESTGSAAARPRQLDQQVGSREELQLQAATQVIANDYEAALQAYLQLSARFPGERVFADIAAILRTKSRCGPAARRMGDRCM